MKRLPLKVINADKGLVAGYGLPFGGPLNGRDLEGEFFDKDTDFALDWFPNEGRPSLYDHGTDAAIKTSVVGRQVSKRIDPDVGIWVETQLNMAHRYADAIMQLAQEEALGFSSGSIKHLIVVDDKTGRIERWPWVEQSLTPVPANPYGLISSEAVKHLQAVGIELPAKALELPEGTSVDDLQERLRAAAKEEFPGLFSDDYCWIAATYDAKFVVSGESGYYEIDFAVDTDGSVILSGPPTEVQRKTLWEPAGKTYGDHAEHLLAEVQAFLTRTRSLADLRTEDGRGLSDGHMKRLASLQGDLDELVATASGHAKALEREALRFQALLASRHGVAAGGGPVA